MMRRLIWLIGCLCLSAMAQADGQQWPFRVSLDETEIGQHTYTLKTQNNKEVLVSDARFEVRLLSIPVYRYRHHAEEIWDGPCLSALKAQTDDNGEITEIDAQPVEAGLSVRSPQSSIRVPGCTQSFAYWSPLIREATRLLNPQTGEITPVKVRPLGQSFLLVRGQKQSATQYQLTAPGLIIDLWYDDQGNWVGLDSKVPTGGILHYRLEG